MLISHISVIYLFIYLLLVYLLVIYLFLFWLKHVSSFKLIDIDIDIDMKDEIRFLKRSYSISFHPSHQYLLT